MKTLVLPLSEAAGEDVNPLLPHTAEIIFGFVFLVQLAGARQEAAKIREDAREQGAQIIAEMREQANAEAERIVSHARTQIDAERAQAVASLRGEVGHMATTLAGRIVGESLEDEAQQRRTVERFLADLEASESARQ